MQKSKNIHITKRQTRWSCSVRIEQLISLFIHGKQHRVRYDERSDRLDTDSSGIVQRIVFPSHHGSLYDTLPEASLTFPLASLASSSALAWASPLRWVALELCTPIVSLVFSVTFSRGPLAYHIYRRSAFSRVVLEWHIPPVSIPFTAASETVRSTFFRTFLVASTGPVW